MRFSALIGFKDDIFAAEACASAMAAQTLVPDTNVAINRDTVAMSPPLARQGERIASRALRQNAKSVAARAPGAIDRYGTDAAAGRSHVALIPTEPPLFLSRTRIRAPLARTPTMSANLVMSDDLSRANAMDRPIVGPLFVLSDYSSRSQLRAAISQVKGATMSDARTSNPMEIEITEPSSLNEQAAVALVIVGALVAVADRRVSPVERDEVIRFIRDRKLAPHISDERLYAMFDELAERLEEPDFANVVIDTLRPVSNLPLSSHLMELSERVAAADEDVHPHEVQAIKLLRLLTLVLPRAKPVVPSAADATLQAALKE
jgi:tellurite resistance protein